MGKMTIIIKFIKSLKIIDSNKMTAIVNDQNMNNVKEIIPENIVVIGSQKLEEMDSAALFTSVNYVTETQKWAVLSTEIMQKQEIIGNLMKQNDDKEEIMKASKQELKDLRNKVQFAKDENENLKKRIEKECESSLPHEETIKLIEEQINKLTFNELVKRTLEMSTLYKEAKNTNDE